MLKIGLAFGAGPIFLPAVNAQKDRKNNKKDTAEEEERKISHFFLFIV